MPNTKDETRREPESTRERSEKLQFTKDTLADLDPMEWEQDTDLVKGGYTKCNACSSSVRPSEGAATA